MPIIPVKIDVSTIQQILNKRPGKTVTAEEWNEILNLLVTQHNILSDNFEQLCDVFEQILRGEVPTFDVNLNVTHLGGRPAEDYALKTYVQEEDKKVIAKINGRFTTPLTAGYVVTVDSSGKLKTCDVATSSLGYIGNVTSDIQTQLNNKLGTSVSGAKAYIQQSQPSSAKTGDLWIGW